MRLDDDARSTEFVEKPRADQIDTNLISAGAYVLERSVLDLIPADRNVSIEREVWPRLVGNGLYGFPPTPTGSTSGRPSATSRARSTSSRATWRPRCASGWATASSRVGRRRRASTAASSRRRSSSAAARSRAGAHVGSLVVLGDGVTVGAARAVERSSCSGRRDRRGLRAARLHRRRRRAHRRRHRVAGGAVLGEGVTIGADNVLAQRRAGLPGHELPDGASGSERSTRRRDARPRGASSAVDASDQLTDVLAHPRAPARRAVEGRVRATSSAGTRPAASSSRAWAARPSAARSRAPRSATTPRARSSRARAYGLPAWTTPDTTVLCASLLGQHRGDARLLRGRRALGAHRVVVTTGGQLAELARADGVPVIPVAGGFQPRAAVAYMTVAALEVAAAVRRRAADDARRSTSPPSTSRSS